MIQLFSLHLINTITLRFAGLVNNTPFYNAIGIGFTSLNSFMIYIIVAFNTGLIANAS